MPRTAWPTPLIFSTTYKTELLPTSKLEPDQPRIQGTPFFYVADLNIFPKITER